MSSDILVPVDGSEHSFKAVDMAADLARVKQSEVHLLHVATHQEVPDGVKEWARVEHVMDSPSWVVESGAAENLLNSALNRLRGNGVDEADQVIEYGNVARTIIDFARHNDIDMIVMGTRGYSDLQGLVMGSVGHKVSHAAPCTVVTVR